MTNELSSARNIDETYERLRGYRRVITKDPALADALNLRVDQARLQSFASTPRGVVYEQEIEGDLRDRKELFLNLQGETDLGWKEAFYYLRQALNCWEQTGSLSELSNYDVFDSDEARTVISYLRDVRSVYRGMGNYEPSFSGDLAVIEPELLTPLDRNILPDDFDTFNYFTDETVECPPFNIFPSTTALIHSITENLTPEEASDVAVVVHPESQYQSLLESAFQHRDIPYMRGESLTEDEHFRTLFKMMRSAYQRNRLRVRDVMPILHNLGLRVPLEIQDSFLEDYENNSIEGFCDLMESVTNSTFHGVLTRFEEEADLELPAFRRVLEELGFMGRSVTPDRLNQLEFYLSNFDEQTDKQDRGVLFASPKSGAYVDRPIVFYVGMDASWTRSIPERHWIDHDRHRRNNFVEFQVMLQNGEHQYYLVQDHHMNADVTPCFYFNVLFDDFERFSDLDHRTMSGLPNLESGSGFDRTKLDVEQDGVESVSQSTLNTFVKSPRDYFFDQLVPTVDNIHIRKGQLFHDFAEFYVNHPSLVNDTDTETFVDIMEESVIDLTDEWSRSTMRTEFRAGIENISQYLQDEGYQTFQPQGYEPNRFNRTNVFAERFADRSIDSPISEAWFESPALGIHGLVDLIPSDDRIVDLKSGRSRSRSKVVEQASPDRFEDNPDFQAILYLAYHRQQYPDQELQFTFFYFLDNLTDVIREEDDLGDTLITVNYYPREFAEQIPKKATFDFLVDGISERNDRYKTLTGLGYKKYQNFFSKNGFPDTHEKREALESSLTEKFVSFCQQNFNDYKYVISGAKSSIKQLIEFRNDNFFDEDIDRFETFLQNQLERLEKCYEDGFPLENKVTDLDLDDLSHRDMIVDDRYE